ncbi:MAG: DUF4878 domain-containing protein [Clostridia bacterium]|nr:DUF4878 domain-containing protein [Clostridia bacterium]
MKRFKSIIAIILTLILILSLTGCGEIKKAETAVNGMFTAFKNLDFEEAQKYVNVDEITKAGEEANENSMLIMETVFDNLSYEIISSEKVDSETVIVKTKVTATDMKPVLGEFLTKALEYAFSNAFANPQPTEEETDKKMEEILVECASKPDLATVTNEVDIKVIKTESKDWKIEADDAVVNALLGGLADAAKEMENAFNTEE